MQTAMFMKPHLSWSNTSLKILSSEWKKYKITRFEETGNGVSVHWILNLLGYGTLHYQTAYIILISLIKGSNQFGKKKKLNFCVL